MRTFVIGDLHGAHRALLQCFQRCNFDYENDELIMLGDICDGWPEVRQCVDELIKVKKLILILGNHDQWTVDWAMGNNPGRIWTQQGGMNTLVSYGAEIDRDPANFPAEHLEFFKKANLWYLDDENRLFVYGGIKTDQPLEGQSVATFLWDRELVQKAYRDSNNKVPKSSMTEYKEIFVGHTTTTIFNSEVGVNQVPLNYYEIWMLDTGAGWEAKLTMMNVETKEYVQSDPVNDLYPGIRGRR